MRVMIWPHFNPKEKGEGGIRRVVEAQHKHLPNLGIEIVDKPERADVINVHADYLETDKPVAYSNHGLYWAGFKWERWSYEVNAKIIQAMRMAHSVSVPSNWVHNSLSRGMLLDPHVLMHGVDIEDWEPGENNGYILWAKNRPDPICDPVPVNMLAQQCPDLQFITTFGSRADNIIVTGRLTYERSKELIRHAGVYLATVMETGGITVLEAMASGVPPVGFAHGANLEIIEHGITGWLVQPGDYEGLREGARYCLQHRAEMGAAARQAIIERFQWKDRIKGYLPFFEEALKNGKPHGPKVSVIVTAYNLGEYLPLCLDSLLQQDFPDWEAIVVDDASPDNCGEIADKYAEQDHRIKVIHNRANAYLAEARNIGIRNSAGQYIIPLDADDMLAPSALRILSEALDRDRGIDITTGAFELIEPDGKHWISTWPPDDPNYAMQIKGHNQIPYASMYRRWVWEHTGGYRRRMKSAEDAEFWTRAMSYGAVPAKVTDVPTLVYHNRPGSMSHTVATPDWNSWYIWKKYPQFTPFGAPDREQTVLSYHTPLLSVIIPCGPGHDIYLQDAVDSIIAQTFQRWEIIVINDTGEKWVDNSGNYTNPYIRQLPAFVKILRAGETSNIGVAAARNRGIAASATDCFVLLDADDYAQPLFLDLLYKSWRQYGGWVYSDWYDQEGTLKKAKDFNFSKAIYEMPGPSSGIYAKKDWELVGGFDEKAPGWEDYLFCISLLSQGICGSKINYGGITYRYTTGTRREVDFGQSEKLLNYRNEKFYDFYHDEGRQMACGKCGAGGNKTNISLNVSEQPEINARAVDGMVLLEYIGQQTQKRRMRSKVNPKEFYIFSGTQRRFRVYTGDVDWIVNMANEFRVVSIDVVQEEMLQELAPVLKAAEPVVPVIPAGLFVETSRTPIDVLPIDGLVLGILKNNGFTTVQQLKMASDADLLMINQLGSARVKTIRKAVNALEA